MGRKLVQHKKESKKSEAGIKDSDVQEFFLLEKLYEAMRNDKKRGKGTSSATREFYLMEKLYEAMRNDKNHTKKQL